MSFFSISDVKSNIKVNFYPTYSFALMEIKCISCPPCIVMHFWHCSTNVSLLSEKNLFSVAHETRSAPEITLVRFPCSSRFIAFCTFIRLSLIPDPCPIRRWISTALTPFARRKRPTVSYSSMVQSLRGASLHLISLLD